MNIVFHVFIMFLEVLFKFKKYLNMSYKIIGKPDFHSRSITGKRLFFIGEFSRAEYIERGEISGKSEWSDGEGNSRPDMIWVFEASL